MARSFQEMGRAVKDVIVALNRYALAYQRYYDAPIGEDAVLGKAWLKIARGAIGLLGGETGSLDPGHADSMIRSLAREAGFKEEEL